MLSRTSQPISTIADSSLPPPLGMGVKGGRNTPKNAIEFALTFAKLSKGNSSEQGMSLLECLLAIVVVAVVITTFTPPIFLAVGTRVQNRRAEQSLQLAQAEVDRVRRTLERGVYEDTHLPPQGSQGNSSFRQEAAPSSTADLPANQLYQSSSAIGVTVDVNGDGTKDFIVQTYRSAGVRDNTNKLVGFNIGVRVYSYAVASNWGLLENPPQKPASLGLTTALGQQRRRPLAVLYTTAVRSDVRTSLQCFHEFLGTEISSTQKCNN